MTAGSFRRPALVGLVEGSLDEEETLYLARLPEGPIVVLRDTALTVWREAVAPSAGGSLAARVARAYDVDVDVVEDAVEACLADLVERGLLETGEPSGAVGTEDASAR